MTLTQEAVRSLVSSKKAMGMSHEEVRDYFKTAFEQKMISVELYTMAIEETSWLMNMWLIRPMLNRVRKNMNISCWIDFVLTVSMFLTLITAVLL